MKKTLQFTCLVLYASTQAFAAVKTGHPGVPLVSLTETGSLSFHQAIVKGTVKDNTGATLPGVSIQVKGTQIVTQTNLSGVFAVPAKQGDILVFSYIGFEKQEITVSSTGNLNVVLNSNSQELNTVVVTALGIKKTEKSLTYATQQISNKDLTTVKTDNLMNSLNGKIAGVAISPSASGVGGSAKVILRGNRSFAGNNQPLYVIDGVPISNATNRSVNQSNPNSSSSPNSTFGGSTNVDSGDGISNLNPDDIESMTILKGASASALYGSDAANGVIVITTKKGKAGKAVINYSSSFQTDNIAYKPKFQNGYGQTSAASQDSYGAPLSGGSQDNLKEFFQTGTNWTNSINFSAGNETAQTYISYANTAAKGVEPGNKLTRHNFNLRETAHFLDNKLTVDGNINYIAQNIENTPGLGLYFNPLTGLYLFPRGKDILPYKNQYEFTQNDGYARQNWFIDQDVQQNPWWITNRNTNFGRRNRVLLNGSVKYDVNNWFNVQLRGNLDRTADRYEQDLYSGTNRVLSRENGQLILNTQTVEQKYGDVLATFTVPMQSKFKIDGILGASIKDVSTDGTSIGAGQGLVTPNLFIVQNIALNSTVSNGSTISPTHVQQQSVFANANVSYQDWAFLNLTGRKDWSSTLAFTPNNSYFYPSVGLTFILNQVLQLPEVLSYAKVRGNYAEVGNAVPPYVTKPVNYTDNSGSVVLNTTAPFATLKPERTKSWEFGTDLRFFQNKLSLSFTYYKSNTYNQFVKVMPIVTTGYSSGYVNAGNVQNTGFEFVLGYNAIKTTDFEWNTNINAARNKNYIVDVDSQHGINEFILTGSGNNAYESHITKGGSYGDIYGYTLQRDNQGRILIGSSGLPVRNEDFQYVGNPNPKFQLGWNNSFTYKNFNLSFLVDGKFGGQVMSITQAMMDEYGVSKESGDARDNQKVVINGVDPAGNPVTSIDPKVWYTAIGGRGGVTGEYMYSATVVRLREAAFGYTFPIKDKFVKNLRLSVTGRNLAYFYKKAPYDPELTLSSGNGLSGVDVFNLPATRSIGFNLNVTF